MWSSPSKKKKKAFLSSLSPCPPEEKEGEGLNDYWRSRLVTRYIDIMLQNRTARLRVTIARDQTARVRSKQLSILSIQVNNYT